MRSVIVREATRADRASLIDLNAELQAFEQGLRASRAPAVEVAGPFTDRQLSELGEGFAIFLAERDGAAVAYLSCRISSDPLERPTGEATIEDLIVTEPCRGEGIGRRLIARAEAFAAERGAARLFVSYLTSNGSAGEAYAAMGFTPSVQTVEKSLGAPTKTQAEGSYRAGPSPVS